VTEEKILLYTKSLIALIIAITVCILTITNGENADMFKVIALAVFMYMFPPKPSYEVKKCPCCEECISKKGD